MNGCDYQLKHDIHLYEELTSYYMQIELSSQQQSVLSSIFDQFNKNDINYVVLRRHEHLLDAVPGSQKKELDIDILVKSDQFQTATDIAQSLDFSAGTPEPTMKDRLHTIHRRVKNPIETVKIISESPEKIEQSMGFRFPSPISPTNKVTSYEY